MKFIFKARAHEADTLFSLLPADKIITYNLPPNASGLVEAYFKSIINPEELKKIILQLPNGSVMMESIKIEGGFLNL